MSAKRFYKYKFLYEVSKFLINKTVDANFKNFSYIFKTTDSSVKINSVNCLWNLANANKVMKRYYGEKGYAIECELNTQTFKRLMILVDDSLVETFKQKEKLDPELIFIENMVYIRQRNIGPRVLEEI